MLNAVQNASVASKVCAFHDRDPESSSKSEFANKPLQIPALLYLATLGGAAVCDLERQIGSFAPGKNFDALLVSVREETGNSGIWGLTEPTSTSPTPDKELEGWLERFLFCGDDRNIERVYVQGRFIGGRTFRE
jgi:guanine deaminase